MVNQLHVKHRQLHGANLEPIKVRYKHTDVQIYRRVAMVTQYRCQGAVVLSKNTTRCKQFLIYVSMVTISLSPM